ncbi:hypothetical protein ACFWOJ_20115 [Streptomyces sp. NPDC058439]|uniref:hypothetical protein n=1 Tax=Streptomyces sp. NPDC058439 TaxID=3346500 RepID=UPI003667E0DB
MTEHGKDTGTPAEAGTRAPGVLQTVDRALLVLLTFTEQRPEWGSANRPVTMAGTRPSSSGCSPR